VTTREPVTRELDRLAAAWAVEAEPYRVRSVPTGVLLDLPSGTRIVAVGREAIPWILARYRTDPNLPWGFVLQRITGQRMVEDPDNYCPLLLKAKWMAWGKRQRQL
jgi:hypothetical protein